MRKLAPIGLIVLAFTGAWLRAEGPFEPPPTLSAAEVADPSLLRGPWHTVRDEVPNDGFLNVYTIDSPFGLFEARGNAMLPVRVHEIGALAQLAEVDEAAVAAGALADSAVQLGKGAANAVAKPKETARNVGSGVKRFVGRLGRQARRVVEQGKEAVDEDDPERAPEGPERTKEEQAQDAAVGVARSLLGVSKAFRDWCRRLEVDPYTDNGPLREAIERVARYDAAGRFAFRLVPLGAVGALAGTARDVNELVWSKDPDELQTSNEQRLTAMGVPSELSREFRLNARLGLSGQVRLVAALDALGPVAGRDEVVRRAAEAPDRDAARFFEESALLLERLHREVSPVRRIVAGSGPVAALTTAGAAAWILPVDHLPWTEEIDGYERRARRDIEKDSPRASRAVWIAGRASERCRTELAARGWIVHEGWRLPRRSGP